MIENLLHVFSNLIQISNHIDFGTKYHYSVTYLGIEYYQTGR